MRLETAYLQQLLYQTYPTHALDVSMGELDFYAQNNQALLQKIVENIPANTPDFVTFQQFQNFFNPALYPKPTKPIPDDPRYHDSQRKALYTKQKYQVYLIWRYEKDRRTYYQQLKAYETQQAKIRFILQHYRNSFESYLHYLRHTFPDQVTAFFSTPYPFRVHENARQRHSYITGQSGSGKTELLKTLIYHYLTKNTQTAVILIDPHGDIARQVAQFKENGDSDRLIYIDPFLSDQAIPVINPLGLIQPNAPERIIDKTAEELASVFKEIIRSNVSEQMETLLRPCITTLLLMGNKDLNDLQKFMDDGRNQDYLTFGIKHLYNPSQVDFLRYDFHKDTYNPTKQAIKTKIQSLLNANTFRLMLSGKPTLMIEQALNEKKLLIFNLSAGRLGSETSDVIGRFLLAQFKSLAFQRAELPESQRPHTHLFIDECQRYLSPSISTILAKSRKYKLFLTLANQYYGQGMGSELKEAINNNTAVKIAGKNGDKNLTTHHKETGALLAELKHLNVGEFHVKVGSLPSVKIKAPINLLNDRNAMTADQWAKQIQRLLADYYHPLQKCSASTTSPTTTSTKQPKTRQESQTINPRFEIPL